MTQASLDKPNPIHLDRPRLRPVEAFAIDVSGRQAIALRDARALTEHIAVITHEAVPIVQQFTGDVPINEIAARAGADSNAVRALAEHLDNALLLHGEKYDTVHRQMLEQFDALPALPIRSASDFTRNEINAALAEAQTHDALTTSVNHQTFAERQLVGLVLPHLDFERGRRNYALGYAALKASMQENASNSQPDRVIVLGTNHRGLSTGVLMCPIGQETNVGTVPVDQVLVQTMHDALGDSLIEHRLDLIAEHSIELQMPWIHHVLGEVPTTGFLVHDPLFADGASYDGNGIALDELTTTLSMTLHDLGGHTLIIASADLSHVGKEFGDEEPNTPDRLRKLETHDREHLDLLQSHHLDEFLTSMKHCRNRTRWCTLGGITALWQLLGPDCDINLLAYEQATVHPTTQNTDECCVSSVAVVLSK